jgi:ferredoxin
MLRHCSIIWQSEGAPRPLFESFLKQYDQAAWMRTLEEAMPYIHEVDRNATRIWFHFFPLALGDALADTGNLAQTAQRLRLDGQYRLDEQVDSSHWFLYGHRYWPHVKAAIIGHAESAAAPTSVELADVLRDLTAIAVRRASNDTARPNLVLGITAVGLMTLRQVGLQAFRGTANGPAKSGGPATAGHHVLLGTPDQIVAARKKNDGQGIAGLWRGIKAQYTVTFDERRQDARFTIINQQQLTTASANDTRQHPPGPRTCIEGPIPVECRTASCGTCWVGILSGAERLSDVDALEAKQMKEFGYIDTPDRKPLIRLACMALASGNVTIVIPPWNGFIGKRTGSRESPAGSPD